MKKRLSPRNRAGALFNSTLGIYLLIVISTRAPQAAASESPPALQIASLASAHSSPPSVVSLQVFSADAGAVSTIHASPDLRHWSPIQFAALDVGAGVFQDHSTSPQRFYRASASTNQARTAGLSYLGWTNALLLANGRAEVVIVPQIGRIMQFRFAGNTNGPFWDNPALHGQPPNPDTADWLNFGGDKSWPAPQGDWPLVTGRAWPPPVGFDAMVNAAEVGSGTVTLISPVDPKYGIKVTRRIELHPTDALMKITTRFERVVPGTAPGSKVSVWTITQLNDPERIFVKTPRRSIFESGYDRQSPTLPTGLTVRNGLISLLRDHGESHKIGTDASTLLWVGAKECLRIDAPRDAEGEYPDSNSSAEVYTNPNPSTYVELEMLGPLARLDAGASLERVIYYTLLPRTAADPETEAARILND